MSLNHKIKKDFGERGFIALSFVIMVSAIAILISVGTILRSISELRMSLYQEKSSKASASVNACGEYAVRKISTTSDSLPGWDYTGGELFDLGDSNCYIYPVVASGTSKVIYASSTVSSFTRKLKIEVGTSTNTFVNIQSWSEISDFPF